MNTPRIRILVVDDSAYSRQTIRNIVSTSGEFEVVGVAANGKEAITRVLNLRPDIVLLDIEMPEMDGFTFLRWMLQNHPVPVIVVSSRNDSQSVFQSMELGAVDFVAKPVSRASEELQNIAEDLLAKIRALADLGMDKVQRRVTTLSNRVERPSLPSYGDGLEIVAIGSSTGGPSALQILLSALPADFPSAVVVSQHMPAGFTGPFAERLNRICNIEVAEAENHQIVGPGRVLIAPGDRHMALDLVNGAVRVRNREPQPSDRYVPSVNVMMVDVARIYGERCLGVILTGMGNDGQVGMLEIAKKGGYTIAESEETAVVFGMPQEAIASGAVRKVLPLEEISREILEISGKSTVNKL